MILIELLSENSLVSKRLSVLFLGPCRKECRSEDLLILCTLMQWVSVETLPLLLLPLLLAEQPMLREARPMLREFRVMLASPALQENTRRSASRCLQAAKSAKIALPDFVALELTGAIQSTRS